MKHETFLKLNDLLETAPMMEYQRKQLIEILDKRKYETGAVGIHLSKEVSDAIDFDILFGLPQSKVCRDYGISRTTFKRHRAKLISLGYTIPNYKTRDQKKKEEAMELERKHREVWYDEGMDAWKGYSHPYKSKEIRKAEAVYRGEPRHKVVSWTGVD